MFRAAMICLDLTLHYNFCNKNWGHSAEYSILEIVNSTSNSFNCFKVYSKYLYRLC